jgi:prepilin-type N-terminal cleavage/methylation domain-containing protein/prepilin-type processing-associated H-X9-DG protein
VKRNAFTLIELLVVIAIIALLMAIVMPSLKKVKDIAAMKLCGNNARQIMLACTMYSQENSEEVPRAITRYKTEDTITTPNNQNYSWSCLPVANPSVSPTSMADFVNPASATLAQRQAGIRHGTLYPYLESTEVYHCPKDNRMAKANGGYRTYSLTEPLFHGWIQADGKPLPKWGPTAIKTGHVKNPSGRMAVIEQGDPRGYNRDGFVFSSDGPTNWEETLAYWHQGGFMYAYFDGHVEYFGLQEIGTEMYNKIFEDNPSASMYYSEHSSLSAYPANQNKDFYNITRLMDNFRHTSGWSWNIPN